MTGVTTTGGAERPRALPLGRLLVVCAVALTTANCANNAQKFAGAETGSGGGGVDPKYGVRASPRLYNEGDVIPKGGGRRFSGKPYVVAGKTYVPREDARGYVREGLASWYGSAFHGRMTANGEVFDRQSIAAAHPTLPLPSYVRVTNVENGHSMVVRVNDRGPYHAGRLMDVSEKVAHALAFHRRGTSRVRVEYVGKASVAGSDDTRLMATLRTDGTPAPTGGRQPVMLADLGADETSAPERFARSAPALAFRPAEEAEDEAPAPAPVRPARPAPVLVAGAPSVRVPAGVQPGTARAAPFRPAAAMVASASPARADAPASAKLAGKPAAKAGQPVSRMAAVDPRKAIQGLNPQSKSSAETPAKAQDRAQAKAQVPAKQAAGTRLAAAPASGAARPAAALRTAALAKAPDTRAASTGKAAAAPMSGPSKAAIARLATSAPAKAGAQAKPGAAKTGRSQIAGVY